jgi:hypothetical protein
MGASLKCLSWSAAEGDASPARTVVHLIVGPARDERCVLSLSCGARLRPGYPQHYCTLRMPVARPAWRYRRSCRPGKSRVTSGYTATSRSRSSASSPTSSSCRRRPALADRTWVVVLVARNPGSQLVAVITEVPGSGVADMRACRVEGNELKTLIERLGFRSYAAPPCMRPRVRPIRLVLPLAPPEAPTGSSTRMRDPAGCSGSAPSLLPSAISPQLAHESGSLRKRVRTLPHSFDSYLFPASMMLPKVVLGHELGTERR